MTHAVIDLLYNRAFHVPVSELNRFHGLEGEHTVWDVSGGLALVIPEADVERLYREAVARSTRGGPAVYLDVAFKRSDVERIWPKP